MNRHTGTVRLVDRKTRVLELLGPEPLGSRRPTDRKLFFDPRQSGLVPYSARPRSVAHCFQADGRTAKFLVDQGPLGDAMLDLLSSRPQTPARPVAPYGVAGWLLEA